MYSQGSFRKQRSSPASLFPSPLRCFSILSRNGSSPLLLASSCFHRVSKGEEETPWNTMSILRSTLGEAHLMQAPSNTITAAQHAARQSNRYPKTSSTRTRIQHPNQDFIILKSEERSSNDCCANDLEHSARTRAEEAVGVIGRHLCNC